MGRHSAAEPEPADDGPTVPPRAAIDSSVTGPIAPLPARRPDPAEPSLLPEDAAERPQEQTAVGFSVRMFLVVLGIGVAGATALSLASLLPR